MKLIDGYQFIREDLKHIGPTSNGDTGFPKLRLNVPAVLMIKKQESLRLEHLLISFYSN